MGDYNLFGLKYHSDHHLLAQRCNINEIYDRELWNISIEKHPYESIQEGVPNKCVFDKCHFCGLMRIPSRVNYSLDDTEMTMNDPMLYFNNNIKK
ncbi:unnamed protein product [Cunninghamella echinulata]